MLEEFERLWDRHLGCINVSEHRIDLLNEEVRLVHSTLYRTGRTMRQCTAAEIYGVLTEKVIGLVTLK